LRNNGIFVRQLKQKLRKKIGPSLQWAAYSTGMMQFLARIKHIKGAIVLMYHSVADESQTRWIDPHNHVPAGIFKEQMEYLSLHRQVIELAELIKILRNGFTPENGTAVITFDDGYLDNLTVAAPILENLGLVATLFLPTGYIDRGETQWVDQAYTAFKFRTRSKLSWKGNQTVSFDLRYPAHGAEAYKNVCLSLMHNNGAKRRNLIDELYVQLSPTDPPQRLTMDWDDVKMLLTKYNCFKIGGHSQEHTDMTRLTEDEMRDELEGCARRIEDVLGIRPVHFSFPYGRTNTQLRKIAAEHGYDCAFGGMGFNPIIHSGTDPYDMPRVEAPALMGRFELAVSTSNTGIWRRLGR